MAHLLLVSPEIAVLNQLMVGQKNNYRGQEELERRVATGRARETRLRVVAARRKFSFRA